MSLAFITLILFSAIILFIFLGVPVSFALGGISAFFIFLLMGSSGLYTVATTAFAQITDTTLITIPLLTLMGQFLSMSGMADRLFQIANYWLSGVKGSMALVSLAVCVALAMTGGFGPGMITMALVAVPVMLNRGYNKSLSLGSVMAGGVLGALIPPSIIMIIFAYINKLSIARLFLGGIGPGLLTAVLFAIYILLRCYLQPHLAPVSAEQVTWKTRLISLREILPPVFLIIAVLGSILTGLATPVEASSIGAIGTLVICIVYRRFTWKGLADACRENLKITCMVMWIMIGANMFRVLLTGAGVQEMLLDLVNGMEVNRWFIIIAMQILLIIFGMVMDDFALVVICSPIFLPIVVTLGFDPLWFAIIFILNMQMALLTPPFGWALILMRGLAPPGVNTKDIWMSVPPFAAVQLLMLIITMLFPPLATWLPGRMMG